MILRRAADRPDQAKALALVMRVRDAARDNLAYDLASRAQGLVVRLRPENVQERVILGSIDASAGRRTAAEQSFLACLAGEPEAADTLARLEALRSGRFAPYAVRQGYGSPKDRQPARLRRRANQGQG